MAIRPSIGEFGSYRAGFNPNPAPTGGSNTPFGAVPGAIGIPQPYSDLAAIYPNLSGTNSAVSSALLSKLHGELSPDTVAQINNAAAEWGVRSGMPGSGIARNRSLRDIGLTSEQVQSEGIRDYGAVLGAASGTQTVRPETQAQIAETNSINAAAPNPAMAQNYAETLFNKYLDRLGGGHYSANSGRPWWMPPPHSVTSPGTGQTYTGYA